MSLPILALVLLAALLHASWNAIVKASYDRTLVLGLIAFGHVIFGTVLAFNVPLPDPKSWPFLAASTIIHFLYYYLLNRSYRLGDLSQVYPVARGISPVLISLGAIYFAGENLSPQAWGGILTVTAGIFLLSSNAFKRGMPSAYFFLALATGLVIATYSLTDGLGARTAQSTLGYIAWLFVLETFVVLFIFARRRGQVKSMTPKIILTGTAGGIISALAYGMVIYAKTLSPLGIVSTLRETSVLFAALIGVIILGERPWRSRLLTAMIVVTGVLILATA